jgi:uncharacterized protein YgiB involved in biofilm formation
MIRLASVQRVKTAAAEADLLAARHAEAEAAAAEAEAKSRTEAARSEWDEHLSGTLFLPEFSGALAARVVEREQQASDAALRSERASDAAERRLDDWQISVARSRSGEASLRKLRRRVRQRAEEDRLAETADRVTFDWSRR